MCTYTLACRTVCHNTLKHITQLAQSCNNTVLDARADAAAALL
jgi:hypothetical protein